MRGVDNVIRKKIKKVSLSDFETKSASFLKKEAINFIDIL